MLSQMKIWESVLFFCAGKVSFDNYNLKTQNGQFARPKPCYVYICTKMGGAPALPVYCLF